MKQSELPIETLTKMAKLEKLKHNFAQRLKNYNKIKSKFDEVQKENKEMELRIDALKEQQVIL